MRTLIYSIGLLCWIVGSAVAQPPGRDSGGRGGFDRGSGGFPGGGFPGGGPPGRGGFDRGGDRGGDRGRGGFDPADMLRRFDRNGNNMIDPDEAEGPARFFLQRLAQNNPRIDLTKPVPIDQLTGEMDRMRGGDRSDRDRSDGTGPSSNEPQLLVPDFSLSVEPVPVAGFGAGSDKLFSVKVEDRDLKEAEERLRRYDRDRDGSLSQEELRSGRWSDDPMQYDRNRDGKLSVSELAVRYANRRQEEEQRRSSDRDSRSGRGEDSRGGRGGDSRWGGGGGSPWGGGGDERWGRGGGDDGWRQRERGAEEPEATRFGDAKSYRSSSSSPATDIKGLPDFFARSDVNGDGQVQMSEFSSSWDAETLAEYLEWDLNRDGVITVRESLAAAKGKSGSSAASSSAASSSSVRGDSTTGGEYMEWATRQLAKYDTNNDGQLTADEWEEMVVKPVGADTNEDGIITVEEYAAFRSKK